MQIGVGSGQVAYCFHSVDGYSKVGSYTGNGSTDGTFVYTGFRPAYVLAKSSSGASSWAIADSSRSTYNLVDDKLQANSNAAENSSIAIDLLSNGFKWRETDGARNGSGSTYIYLCFAETPFKYSNAR